MDSLNRTLYKKFNYDELNKNLYVKVKPPKIRFLTTEKDQNRSVILNRT